MATLVLTAVGTLVGGPIGGALGALAGQQIDAAIFGKPKSRQGPRLSELSVQTSSYGTQIPAVLGRIRMAGTVIWASDLIEQRVKSSGGKNKPSTVNYSYSVNLAVAISSQPVQAIGKIWADGNLIRGEDGIFKVDTEFRFHGGADDQIPDPLIASAETIGLCPAYRGLSYVVFEGLQLADFGNRVPSFSFEVIQRPAPVSVAEIMGSASAGLVAGESAETISGYALQGDSVRAAIEPLVQLFPISIAPDGNGLRVRDWVASTASHTLNAVAETGSNGRPPIESSFPGSDGDAPSYALRYFDISRDFQAGMQVSSRSSSGRKPTVVEFPGALDAASALRLAELQLLNLPRRSLITTGTFSANESRLGVGDEVTLAGDQRSWQVSEVESSGLLQRIKLHAALIDPDYSLGAVDPGRSLAGPDLTIGTTTLLALDLPFLPGGDANRANIMLAAAGQGPGWRRAALSLVDGANRIELGQSASPAIIGNAINILPPHSPQLLDTHNVLTVRLMHQMMELPAGPGDALSINAPHLWLGGEIIRYGRAERINETDYRISQLLRGVAGSEHLIAAHGANEPVVLLDATSLYPVDPGLMHVGEQRQFEASGLADVAPATAQLSIYGNALMPLPPVHLRWTPDGLGGGQLDWFRRSRLDTGWRDSVDLPIGEDRLAFEIRCLRNALQVDSWTVEAEHLSLSAAEVLTLAGDPVAPLDFEVCQIGTYTKSRAGTLRVIIPQP